MTTWTLLIGTHAFAASLAVPLGGYQLLRKPHGDARHRRAGRVWVVAMLYTAITSFWIRDLRPGSFSLLHVLSVVTIVSVVAGIVAVRRGNLAAHRGAMRGSWLGVLGAFAGAVAVPDRLIPRFVLGDPLGAATALGAVLTTFLVVITLATGPWWPGERRPRRAAAGAPPTPARIRR